MTLETEYRSAWRRLFGDEPPVIKKVSARTWRIWSADGVSPNLNESRLRGIIESMKIWARAV